MMYDEMSLCRFERIYLQCFPISNNVRPQGNAKRGKISLQAAPLGRAKKMTSSPTAPQTRKKKRRSEHPRISDQVRYHFLLSCTEALMDV